MTPEVIVSSKTGKDKTNLISRDFTDNRSIYLFDEVNNSTALDVILQLKYLDKNGTGDITLYINSPGGLVTAGLAIIDEMNRCSCDVSTVCTGLAASMGAFILSCGKKGKRFATPLSEIMIHQPLGQAYGQASDMELAANHIIKTKKRLNDILAENTGKAVDEVARDCDRDYYMTAEEALEYGVIDGIFE